MKNCDVRYDFVYEMVTNFIIDENIKLPIVDIFSVCKKLNILIFSDEEIKNKFSLDYYRMVNSDDGAAIYLSKTDQYIIVYNTKVSKGRRIKFTIGHELAHIILGHFDYDIISYECKEKEAEYFSMLLLMHPLFLWRNLMNSAKEVEFQCQTTTSASLAAFNNFKNFCRLHIFHDYDLHLILQIDKSLQLQRRSALMSMINSVNFKNLLILFIATSVLNTF